MMLVSLITLFVVGCGGNGEAPRPLPADVVQTNFARLRIGTPLDEVLRQLGSPVSRTSEGQSEELNYGRWQVSVKDGRVERKTIVKGPAPRSQRKVEVTAKEMLDLPLGSSIRRAEGRFGGAEASYESWEGRDERVTVLRYGEWQLTFVDGRLNQRSR